MHLTFASETQLPKQAKKEEKRRKRKKKTENEASSVAHQVLFPTSQTRTH